MRSFARWGRLATMTILGLALLLLPAVWVGVVAAGWLFGRAADQGMYMGMASPQDPDQQRSIKRGIGQQKAQGRLASVLLRWWPLALASSVAGVIVLVTS